MNTYQNAQNK